MMAGCLLTGAHYLDITGEIGVIEAAHDLDQRARAAGVTLMPAVGFDVVPSDCLAAMLAERLPGAQLLQLGFPGIGALSPGTAKTALEGMPLGGRARINGRIETVPIAWKSLEIPFREKTMSAMTIPWGDVASAYYSTGIPNIEVYLATPRRQIRWARRLRFLVPLARLKPIQRLASSYIERKVTGPTEQDRRMQRSSFWGRVTDAAGKTVSATMTGPSGYQLTVLTAVASAQRVLAGGVRVGFATPSLALGKEFILGIPDVDLRWEST
jgi:short subunit dehydrogenase-like uncharacterized protein